jgi:hypothetical protein
MKSVKSLSIFTPLFLSIAVIFIACGGGGGGGGGGGIAYTGITSQATIDETNAVDLVTGAYYGGEVSITMALGVIQTEEDRQISRPRILIVSQALNKCIDLVDFTSASSSTLHGIIYEETIYGNCGGSASIRIDVNDSGGFTGSFNFNNYCEYGVTISGSTSFSGEVDVGTGNLQQFSFSFDNLSFNDGIDSFTIAGNISFNYWTYPATVSMDIKLRDGSTGKVYWVNNYNMSVTEHSDCVYVEISGRYYDPDYGYVVVHTEVPLRFYYDDVWASLGVLVVEGSTGIAGGSTMAWLTALTSKIYQVEADTDGDGSYDWDSGGLPWTDEIDNTPPTTPTVGPVTSLTNLSSQILSGTKEAKSSIWINGTEAVAFDADTIWSASVTLTVEGTNAFSITSKDAFYNESDAVAVAIVYDITLPTNPIVSITVNPDKTVTISWSSSFDSSGILEYRINRDTMPIARTTETSYSDMEVEPGNITDYCIMAVDIAGNISDCIPQTANIPPGGTGAFNTQFQLTWPTGVGTIQDLKVADIDGDGSRDIVAFSKTWGGRIVIYCWPGDQFRRDPPS